MWKTIKNKLIAFAVRGLIKAGRADDAYMICREIIDEIENQRKGE